MISLCFLNLTRLELRLPDPSTNPYLLLATILAAALNGIENKVEPDQNHELPDDLWLTGRPDEIKVLPRTLYNAIDELKKDTKLTESIGKEIVDAFIAKKEFHWEESLKEVTQFELDLVNSY